MELTSKMRFDTGRRSSVPFSTSRLLGFFLSQTVFFFSSCFFYRARRAAHSRRLSLYLMLYRATRAFTTLERRESLNFRGIIDIRPLMPDPKDLLSVSLSIRSRMQLFLTAALVLLSLSISSVESLRPSACSWSIRRTATFTPTSPATATATATAATPACASRSWLSPATIVSTLIPAPPSKSRLSFATSTAPSASASKLALTRATARSRSCLYNNEDDDNQYPPPPSEGSEPPSKLKEYFRKFTSLPFRTSFCNNVVVALKSGWASVREYQENKELYNTGTEWIAASTLLTLVILSGVPMALSGLIQFIGVARYAMHSVLLAFSSSSLLLLTFGTAFAFLPTYSLFCHLHIVLLPRFLHPFFLPPLSSPSSASHSSP
jgi:hypothetical protein